MTTNGTSTFTANGAASYRFSSATNQRGGKMCDSAPSAKMKATNGVTLVDQLRPLNMVAKYPSQASVEGARKNTQARQTNCVVTSQPSAVANAPRLSAP